MSPSRNTRSKNRAPRGKSVRVPKSIRASTYYKIHCPPAPPARASRPVVRRLVQLPFTVNGGSRNITVGDFCTDATATTQYDNILVHSVKAWTESSTSYCSISLCPVTPSDRPDTQIVFSERAPSADARAAVAYALPNDISGPFKRTEKLVNVKTTASAVVLEIDATFC